MSVFKGMPEKRATQALTVGIAGTRSTSSSATAFLKESI
jgi:hypothetical protein